MSSRTKTIPIVVLTASDDPGVRAQALQAQVLRKPCEAAALLAAVQEAMDQGPAAP
jgi:CheY-like chemotaxis protein